MATEAPIEATEVLPAPDTVEKQPHKLERRWTFWFDKPKQGAVWASALRKAYTFETVEEFWRYTKNTKHEITSRFFWLYLFALI